MAGEGEGVAGIVGGVMQKLGLGETHAVEDEYAENDRQYGRLDGRHTPDEAVRYDFLIHCVLIESH